MKKRYIIFIFLIIFMMMLTLGCYCVKLIYPEFVNFNFITNLLSNSNQYQDDENMYNLVPSERTISNNETSVSTDSSIGYDSLSTNSEKKCYSLIKKNADLITNKKYKNYNLYVISPISVPNCNLSTAQIKKVLYAIQFDYPEIFWISNSFSYNHSGNTTIVKLNSTFTKDDQKNAVAKLKAKVSEIVKEAKNKGSDYEKELYIHDYIIDHCTYERSNNNALVYTSYGCLVEGKAVCEGISKAMQLLLVNCGVKCQTVTGARNTEPHMWNIVKVNGNWYHVDTTWDAAGFLQRYDYLNLSDKLINKTHRVNRLSKNSEDFSQTDRLNFYLPECNHMEENYLEKNSIKINSLNNKDEVALTNALIRLASDKQERLHLMINPTNFRSVKNGLLNKNPYTFFKCIKIANKSLPKDKQLSTSQTLYSENTVQNVLTLKLIYS